MNKKRKRLFGIAAPLIVGAVTGFSCVIFTQKLNLNIFTLVLGMLAAFFLQIIIHEAGHLVFGLLSGYSFSSFRIMSFMWVREDGKVKMKRLSLAGTGGQCLMSPPELKDGKIPVFWYNMGGALMNLLTSSLFLALHFVFENINLLSGFLMELAIVGFLTALMNGIPIHTELIDNDGYNALSLSKDKKAMRALWVQLKVNDWNTRGVRLKDMPAELFEIPAIEDMKNSMVGTIGVFAANRMMDEHRFEEAEELMQRILEADTGIAGVYRNLMMCDRIYIELTGENRKEVIEAMYTKELQNFMKQMKKFPTILRTQYVYELLGENNTEEAEKYKKMFEEVSRTYPYQTDICSERELMELAEKKTM